jgi:hypothetical protein
MGFCISWLVYLASSFVGFLIFVAIVLIVESVKSRWPFKA